MLSHLCANNVESPIVNAVCTWKLEGCMRWATIGGQDVERLLSASTCYNTKRLVDIKDHEFETRKFILQTLRCAVELVVEGNGVLVQSFNALIASRAKQCDGRRQTASWG